MESLSVLVVAVDLTPLKPGGENGGHKPAIFSMLAEAGRQRQETLVFIFLTNSDTHSEVRKIARPQDLLICVLDRAASLELKNEGTPAEFKLTPPPKNLVSRIGADVFYCPFGAAAFHTSEVPTVAFIADLLHRDYPFTLTSAQIAERETHIAKTVSVAAMIQCNSRSMVERMIVHYQFPEEKLFYTYLPVQALLDADPATSEELVRKLGINAPFFFYPANLWKHKNHETLLVAYRLYREQAGDAAWDLVLTFHEDKRAGEIRELIQALGIEAHVHCPGYVSEAGLRALWQSAGALVFPSLHEGFGIPLVEAMHYGAPIIAGSDFSLSEIGGDACYRVNPRKVESVAEGLQKVSQDGVLREKLKCLGRQRLKFFDLQIETRKLLDVLWSLPSREGTFPRKPLVLEKPYVLATPTPASDELWTVEIGVDPQFPQNRYSVYLDDAAYGSFSCSSDQGPIYRFKCRPQSRTLRIVLSRDRTLPGTDAPIAQNVIEKVVAEDPVGNSLTLFKRMEGDSL